MSDSATFNSEFMNQIPEEILKAARTVFEWTEKNGWKDWSLGGVSSRKYCESLREKLRESEAELKREQHLFNESETTRRESLKFALESKDKLTQSEAANSQMREAIEDLIGLLMRHHEIGVLDKFTAGTECPVCKADGHTKAYKALSLEAGKPLLKEMEELRNSKVELIRKHFEYAETPRREIKELTRKLEVAMKCLEYYAKLHCGPKAEKALAEINK